ncbi:hypothetical protein CYMTET_31955, partial [Cymbomonas tetramitiformis]
MVLLGIVVAVLSDAHLGPKLVKGDLTALPAATPSGGSSLLGEEWILHRRLGTEGPETSLFGQKQ